MSMTKSDLLVIPENMESSVPCLTKSNLFHDAALDVDKDDEEWTKLSPEEQSYAEQAQTIAIAKAEDACMDCPIFVKCKAWITDLEKDPEKWVSGVVAGQSEEKRHKQTARGSKGEIRGDLVANWSALGFNKNEIADKLDASTRTVERQLAKLKEGSIVQYPQDGSDTIGLVIPISLKVKTAERIAITPLQPGRINSASIALFDALIDGAQKDRDEIVDSILYSVDRPTALAKAPGGNRVYDDEEDQFKTGARKFIMNRVMILTRSGRIIQATTPTGRILISLDPESAAVWREFRKPKLNK
jgi:hypothetical protein